MSELEALINRRRRQLHVHSVLYYSMDTSIVSDATFDTWAKELVELQEAHPATKRWGYRPDLFWNWTGDTGMHLLPDGYTKHLAALLLQQHLTR